MSKWIPEREADMSPAIIEYLKYRGYVVYGEVPDQKGIIDHVGMNRKEIIAVELKLDCNLRLIEQAQKNKWYANKSYICFPFTAAYTGKNAAELSRIVMLCEDIGLGILKYAKHTPQSMGFISINKYNTKIVISEYLAPRIIDHPKWINIIKNNLTDDKIDVIGGIYHKEFQPKKKQYKNNIRRKKKLT